MSTRPSQPWHADAISFFQSGHPGAHCADPSDYFMPGYDGKLRIPQLAVDEVQIRSAHAAGETAMRTCCDPKGGESVSVTRNGVLGFSSRMARTGFALSLAGTWPRLDLAHPPGVGSR